MGIVGCGKSRTFAAGEMAEWSIAAVLKTVDLNGSGGSNPSLSASEKAARKALPFFVRRIRWTLAFKRMKADEKEPLRSNAFSLARMPAAAKGYAIP